MKKRVLFCDAKENRNHLQSSSKEFCKILNYQMKIYGFGSIFLLNYKPILQNLALPNLHFFFRCLQPNSIHIHMIYLVQTKCHPHQISSLQIACNQPHIHVFPIKSSIPAYAPPMRRSRTICSEMPPPMPFKALKP